MAKLDDSQKSLRKELLTDLRNSGGEVYTFRDLNLTVAVRPAIAGNGCRFVHFSVAECATGDKFKRKLGELTAVDKMYMGQFLSLKWGKNFDGGPMELHEIADDVANFFA